MLWILMSKWEGKPQLRFLSYTVLNDNESCFKKINTHLRMQQMKKKVTLNVRCKLVIILYLFPDYAEGIKNLNYTCAYSVQGYRFSNFG